LNTSSGVANWVNELPSCEIVCPAQNRLKSELNLAAGATEASTTPPILAVTPRPRGAFPDALDM
jgi:hypothetical protein